MNILKFKALGLEASQARLLELMEDNSDIIRVPDSKNVQPPLKYIGTLADAVTPSDLVKALQKFVSICEKQEVKFSGNAELSLHFSVGGDDQFVACFELSPSDMNRLAQLGISITCWLYPTSD